MKLRKATRHLQVVPDGRVATLEAKVQFMGENIEKLTTENARLKGCNLTLYKEKEELIAAIGGSFPELSELSEAHKGATKALDAAERIIKDGYERER